MLGSTVPPALAKRVHLSWLRMHRVRNHYNSRKLLQCKQCYRQTSLISGTLFASTNLPLTIWFLGIYLITQSKDGISSLNLARHLGISANAALRMKHKLQQAMKNSDESTSSIRVSRPTR
jgi:transposase-like protein